MDVGFASDLHEDYNCKRIDWENYPADVLVIAGDVSNSIDMTAKTLNDMLKTHDKIIFVDGNHEHFENAKSNRTVEQTLDELALKFDKRIIFLPKSGPVLIEGKWFIGVNGWYSFDYDGEPGFNKSKYIEKNAEMNDNKNIGFTAIKQIMPWDLAIQQFEQIQEQINAIVEKDRKSEIIVVTHTAPTRKTVGLEAKNLLQNAYFANLHMEKILKNNENIIAWTHGHTHQRSMKYVEGIPIIVNPRGTQYEDNSAWEPVVLSL